MLASLICQSPVPSFTASLKVSMTLARALTWVALWLGRVDRNSGAL